MDINYYNTSPEAPLGGWPMPQGPVKEYILSEEELKALYEYFMKHAGYISEEHCPMIKPMIKEMRNYLE